MIVCRRCWRRALPTRTIAPSAGASWSSFSHAQAICRHRSRNGRWRSSSPTPAGSIRSFAPPPHAPWRGRSFRSLSSSSSRRTPLPCPHRSWPPLPCNPSSGGTSSRRRARTASASSARFIPTCRPGGPRNLCRPSRSSLGPSHSLNRRPRSSPRPSPSPLPNRSLKLSRFRKFRPSQHQRQHQARHLLLRRHRSRRSARCWPGSSPCARIAGPRKRRHRPRLPRHAGTPPALRLCSAGNAARPARSPGSKACPAGR